MSLCHIFAFACSLGCIIHLASISQIYFAYPTTNRILIRTPRTVHRPGLTICLPLDNVCKDTCSILSSFLELEASTLAFEQVLTTCRVLSYDSSNYSDCSEYYELKVTYRLHLKCFSFWEKRILDSSRLTAKSKMALLDMSLDNRHGQGGSIWVHEPQDIGSKADDYLIIGMSNNVLAMKFGETRTTLLKSPYASNCYDYKVDHFRSKADCVTTCKSYGSMMAIGQWLTSVPLSAMDNVFAKRADTFASSSLIALNERLNIACNKHCHRDDCDAIFYSMKTKAPKGTSSILADRLTITVGPKAGLRTRSTEQPMMTMTEFICLLGGVFNFWFGWSVIAITKLLRRKNIKKARKYFTRKKSITPLVTTRKFSVSTN
ncbi:hypothetical protein HDE_12894 [Halotydeus destructor]|nr:hypothetical protein HDE_12894 [Halotydeus destructor]